MFETPGTYNYKKHYSTKPSQSNINLHSKGLFSSAIILYRIFGFQEKKLPVVLKSKKKHSLKR